MPSVVTNGTAEINNLWLVCHDHGRVFAPISKNANTSLKRSIQDISEKYDFVTKDTVIDKYGFYRIVAVTRNPFERLVSCYEWMANHNPGYPEQYDFPSIRSFGDFIRGVADTPDEVSNKHFRSQYNLLSQDGIFLPDRVIDLHNIHDLTGEFPIKKFRNNKQTDHSHYQQYYTDELKSVVEKRFWNDLRQFGYSF